MKELAPNKGEKISSHVHKTRTWYLLKVLFKISNEHPHPFICKPLHPGASNSFKQFPTVLLTCKKLLQINNNKIY